MSHDYQLVTEFKSYATKPDKSNTDPRYLVKGSKNVLINDAEKIETRLGYTRVGAAASGADPIESSFEWETSTGEERPLRCFNDEVQVYLNSVWETVIDSLTSVACVFDSWWNNTQKIDELLFVNGTSNLYAWSGACATLSAITDATHITINEDIGESRFYASTGTIRIKDSGGTWREAVYSSFTGSIFTVSTDLTGFTFDDDAPVLQKVTTNANEPASGFASDFLKVINNHVYIGSYSSRLVYFSQNDDVTDYSFSSPRIAGEGGLLTLDDVGSGIAALDDAPVIFSGQNFIYTVRFTEIEVSGTLSETVQVKRLKTTSGQSAISHDLITDIGNAIAYVGNDKVLRILEQAEQVETPLLRDASDIIKPDFDALNFTNGHLRFHKTRLYIAVPSSNTSYILEFRQLEEGGMRRFWQPPQTLPFRRFAVIGGLIHGHSSGADETYKLFDGYSDNGSAIHFVAKLARLNHKKRARLKYVDEVYVEGQIRGNSDLSVLYEFEDDGGQITSVSKTIDGTDTDIQYEQYVDPSLGVNELGVIGLTGDADDDADDPKFRVNHDFEPRHYFDMQATFESNDVDQGWQILAYGPNALIDGEISTAITK